MLAEATHEAEPWWTLLHYAIMAPSSHNTQPWRFRIRGRTVELRADRSRALPVVDPDGRELVISCGAALLHLRVAMRHFGLGGRVEVLPDPADEDLLAIVETGVETAAIGPPDCVFEAITERRTDRAPFDPEPLPRDLIDELEQAARAEGAWLVPVRAAADRQRLADLVGEADLMQSEDVAIRREMAAWVRPNDSTRRDGLRGYSFGHGALASRVAAAYVKYYPWGEAQAASDRELAVTAPLLAVLGTDSDNPAGWLRAGQALGRVLLLAQARGFSASFFNQVVQVASARERVRAVVAASGFPQLCLRFGRGAGVLPSARRPLEEVVDF